ncbi:MAG: mfpsA 2 [Mucilaginibacter sp.]|nr:mfpsA 2 [Mucilaginibacter sp.]
MHITVDARMYNSSGIGTYLKNLLTRLLPIADFTLLGDLKELHELSDRAKIISFTAPIYSIEEQLSYRKIIPECDVFWSPHYNVPFLPIKAKKRLVTIHDVYHLAHYDTLTTKQKLYARLIMNKAVSVSDLIITVSGFSKNEILKYTNCKQGKIKVIYNGVNTPPNVYNYEMVKNKYKLPDKYLLYVGNVKPHKNLGRFLKAYLQLSPQLQNDYKLVIAGKIDGFITGDKQLFDFIEVNDGIKNNIIFTGYIDDGDMDSIYNSAKLFIFPSIYEGFGLPPLEAMANHCPVTTSDTTCIPEICGDAVSYFDPLDVADIYNKISELLNNDEKINELINKGNKQAAKFTWDKSVKDHLHLIESIFS